MLLAGMNTEENDLAAHFLLDAPVMGVARLLQLLIK